MILGVNSDDDRKKVGSLCRKEKFTWRSWFDGGTRGPIATRWQVNRWPTVFLIDHRGVIRARGIRGDALERMVEKLVVEAESDRERR